MDTLYFIFMLATFIAVVLMIEGLLASWHASHGTAAKRISFRLKMMSSDSHAHPASLSIMKKRMLSEAAGMHDFLISLPGCARLDHFLEQSGMTLNLMQFLSISASVAGLSFTLLALAGLALPWCFAVSCIALFLPWILIRSRRIQRMSKIEQQLPDALDLMGRAMRAGNALPAAIQMVSEEMPDPIAREFRYIFDEVSFGVSMQDALKNLSLRVPVNDVGYFIVAVLIQRETGGNLAELLQNISSIVRQRLKLYGDIQVISSEGRLSAWILILLPIAMAGLLEILNPQLISILWSDPIGQEMLGAMFILLIIGIIWIKKIIRIHV